MYTPHLIAGHEAIFNFRPIAVEYPNRYSQSSLFYHYCCMSSCTLVLQKLVKIIFGVDFLQACTSFPSEVVIVSSQPYSTENG